MQQDVHQTREAMQMVAGFLLVRGKVWIIAFSVKEPIDSYVIFMRSDV